MTDTVKMKMTADWIIKGERWEKGETYDAAPREREILLTLDKAKVVITKTKE